MSSGIDLYMSHLIKNSANYKGLESKIIMNNCPTVFFLIMFAQLSICI